MSRRTPALIFALTTALVWTQPAHAQLGGGGSGTNNAPPADNRAVSPGGVDMRTGHYAYDATDLTIGAGNPGDLSLNRINSLGIPGHVDAFANFASSWDIMITEKLVNITEQNFQHGSGPDLEMSVRYGGRSDTFRRYSGSGFQQVSMAGSASLTWTGTVSAAVYTYVATDGTLVTFRTIGGGDCSTAFRCAYASQIVEPDGVKYTLEYDNSGPARLRSVVSSRGYALLLEYTGNNVSKACVLNLAFATKPSNNVCTSGALATTTYSYTTFGGTARLASVTNAGATSSFTYGGTSPNFTMGFVKPGDSTPWLTNTYYLYASDDEGTGEVISRQDFADGSYYTYNYSYMPEIAGVPMKIAGGTYTDVASNVTTVEYSFPIVPGSQSQSTPIGVGTITNYQTTSGPTTVSGPAGTFTYDYCDRYTKDNLPPQENNRCLVSMLQSVTDPEGIKTEYSYDGWTSRNVILVRRNAKPASLDGDIVTEAFHNCTYAILCSKPAWTEDALDKRTDYTHNSTHGGVLTESAPADVDGVRPVKRYAYAQRYAWLSNGSGGYTQSPDAIWVLTEMRTCKTTTTVSNGCAGGTGDEVVTSYDYGPNSGPSNLLLRGMVSDSAGLALRTCYGYDQLGNRISTTAPRAGLTACP